MLIKRCLGKQPIPSIDFFNFNIPPCPPPERGIKGVRLIANLKQLKVS